MTDEQIKEVHDRAFVRLNARQRRGLVKQDEYEFRAELIRKWAERKYADSFYEAEG